MYEILNYALHPSLPIVLQLIMVYRSLFLADNAYLRQLLAYHREFQPILSCVSQHILAYFQPIPSNLAYSQEGYNLKRCNFIQSRPLKMQFIQFRPLMMQLCSIQAPRIQFYSIQTFRIQFCSIQPLRIQFYSIQTLEYNFIKYRPLRMHFNLSKTPSNVFSTLLDPFDRILISPRTWKN